jgi:hypothetical protein
MGEGQRPEDERPDGCRMDEGQKPEDGRPDSRPEKDHEPAAGGRRYGLAAGRTRVTDWDLEVIVMPVTDVDRAKHFYSAQAGFVIDLLRAAGGGDGMHRYASSRERSLLVSK